MLAIAHTGGSSRIGRIIVILATLGLISGLTIPALLGAKRRHVAVIKTKLAYCAGMVVNGNLVLRDDNVKKNRVVFVNIEEIVAVEPFGDNGSLVYFGKRYFSCGHRPDEVLAFIHRYKEKEKKH